MPRQRRLATLLTLAFIGFLLFSILGWSYAEEGSKLSLHVKENYFTPGESDVEECYGSGWGGFIGWDYRFSPHFSLGGDLGCRKNEKEKAKWIQINGGGTAEVVVKKSLTTIPATLNLKWHSLTTEGRARGEKVRFLFRGWARILLGKGKN